MVLLFNIRHCFVLKFNKTKINNVKVLNLHWEKIIVLNFLLLNFYWNEIQTLTIFLYILVLLIKFLINKFDSSKLGWDLNNDS